MEPIFPGYVFVNLDFKSDNWAAVKYTRGVLGLVQFGQKPAIVSTKIIEDLRENAPKSQINLSADESFSTGDTVSITEGSLKGLNAIYQCSSGKDRVIVLINLLGHNTKAGIKQDYIRKVSSV